jgi:two-component system phosphate regulon sensor histidine kinase PhoR
MRRWWVSSHDMICVCLAWAPFLAVAIALSLRAGSAWVISIGGLAALIATWLYAALVARPRLMWLQELESLAGTLRRAVEPDTAPNTSGSRAQRVVDDLRSLQEPIVGRMQAALTDASNVRSLYDASPSPSLAFDSAGRVVLCNRAAQAFFSRAGEVVVGKPIEHLFTQAEVIGQHAAALAGTQRTSQVRMIRPEGLRTYQVFSSPVQLREAGSAGAGVIMTVRDVTELAQAAQLKTDFVANASHELRTPLSSIRAAVETLSDGAWDDPPMRDRLAQVIGGNVARLEEMVRDLLDLSRLDTPDAPVTIEPVALSDVCDALAETFEGPTKERRLTLAFDLAPACDRLETDVKLLTLILRNLIDNASKFAYEGSTVRIVAELLPPRSRQREGEARDGLRVRVIDKGVGIPYGHQNRIFERFYQVDPSRAGATARRGTGLGLAIVKHAVKALGGSIGVESVWKEGTTITVELPSCVLRA